MQLAPTVILMHRKLPRAEARSQEEPTHVGQYNRALRFVQQVSRQYLLLALLALGLWGEDPFPSLASSKTTKIGMVGSERWGSRSIDVAGNSDNARVRQENWSGRIPSLALCPSPCHDPHLNAQA